jgi:hypothetical protein
MLLLTLGELISTSFVSIGIWIVSGVYSVAAFTFEIFLILASGKIIDQSIYSTLVTNFYVVLGVVMIFFLSFILLKNMVNPDSDKGGTSAVKKVIINLVTSSIILAILPTAFSFAFDFQDAVIVTQNTIGRFFGYGGRNSNNPQETAKNGAVQIANGVFTAFFAVDMDQCRYHFEAKEGGDDSGINWNNIDESAIKLCEGNATTNHKVYKKNLEGCKDDEPKGDPDGYCDDPYQVDPSDSSSISFLWVKDAVEYYGNFGLYQSLAQAVNDGRITFNFLLALAGGCLLVYVGISYCIDMGIRLAKLCFYQIIAPIPIFMRVLVDTKYASSFNNWLKVTLTCYGEVYIRVFLLYMVVFLTKAFMASKFFAELTGSSWLVSLFAKAFAFVGLLLFMKQAPQAFADATGLDSGNMKIGIKDRLKEAWNTLPGHKTVGSLAKKTTLGLGAMAAGRRFQDGWRRVEGEGLVGARDRMMQKYFPYQYEKMKQKREAGEQSDELTKKIRKGEDTRDQLLQQILDALKKDKSKRVMLDEETGRHYYVDIDPKTGKEVIDEETGLVKKNWINAGAGEYIENLATSPNASDEDKKLAEAYKKRKTTKGRMLEAKARYEAAQAGDYDKTKYTSQADALQKIGKEYNELNDSYTMFDNEWKQRITSADKDTRETYEALKYVEDRDKGLDFTTQEEEKTRYEAKREKLAEEEARRVQEEERRAQERTAQERQAQKEMMRDAFVEAQEMREQQEHARTEERRRAAYYPNQDSQTPPVGGENKKPLGSDKKPLGGNNQNDGNDPGFWE